MIKVGKKSSVIYNTLDEIILLKVSTQRDNEFFLEFYANDTHATNDEIARSRHKAYSLINKIEIAHENWPMRTSFSEKAFFAGKSWNPIYVNMFDAKHISIRRAVTDSLIKGKISRNNGHFLQINCPQSEMRQIVESLKTLELNLSLDKSNNL